MIKQDSHNENNRFLAQWLAGDISDEQLKSLVSSEEFTAYTKIRKGLETIEALDAPIDSSLEQIKARMANNGGVVRSLQPLRWVVGVAASIIVLFGMFTFLNNDTVSFNTNFGEQQTIALLDGSEVILNAKSTLSYNEDEWTSNRSIELDGEAYFKVEKGSTFTVNTDNGSVTVLGTEFDVNAFKDYFEVTCYEGKVRVESLNESFILVPGQTVRRINGDSANQWESTVGAPSWINGESSFKSVPITYVIATLESQYDITINSEGIDDSIIYTGSFTHGDLDVALQTVFRSLDLNYIEKEKGNIYLSAQ
ncbi:FecR family protein [Psychroserpens sp.]|uniref:FecR family protein n=1 Tax=Psychroserpens sp. TaxID=2020870 RepID=UPI001B2DB6DC|nr:FecR domain-containing protein [Psychroserpens sp.]MBO6607116.1 FecR domain-containing protein [Psychroserpens sp.]MBO6654262.1 FecR domain-containing protein [Psychroserpens sp.]MBO6682452.1 FecR domain-containing protein [Psychroserpens sp.]MBO6750888.1 FecR domain-containing protein [Psychroserpens sp.]MBO6915683.1 FecR domain-containing protein [Psychroserpens sp.]